MKKTLFPLITAMALVMYLTTACAEKDNDAKDAAQTDASSGQVAASAEETKTVDKGDSIMDQPVDFSTPEKAEESLQNIREQEGEEAYKSVISAIQYVMFYDLSIARDKSKSNNKLDGKTPNEIIAMTQR